MGVGRGMNVVRDQSGPGLSPAPLTQPADLPPSTVRMWPVTKLASSEAT